MGGLTKGGKSVRDGKEEEHQRRKDKRNGVGGGVIEDGRG